MSRLPVEYAAAWLLTQVSQIASKEMSELQSEAVQSTVKKQKDTGGDFSDEEEAANPGENRALRVRSVSISGEDELAPWKASPQSVTPLASPPLLLVSIPTLAVSSCSGTPLPAVMHHVQHTPTTDPIPQTTTSGLSAATASMKTANKSGNTKYVGTTTTACAVKAVLRRKFAWKDYPELERFLINKREEYLSHSRKYNYTSTQKVYNNALTEELLELANSLGYVFDRFSFVMIRDRIRCYFKSYIQAVKKGRKLHGMKIFPKEDG